MGKKVPGVERERRPNGSGAADIVLLGVQPLFVGWMASVTPVAVPSTSFTFALVRSDSS